MIRQVRDRKSRARFLKQCRGVPYFGCVLPLHLTLFGKSQPGRFYSGPTLALEVGGRTASLCGHCDPEELASFLTLCGSPPLMTDGQIPAGWEIERQHHMFTLAAGHQLPLPAADEALWQGLRLDREPRPYPLAETLFADRPERIDDFYADLCVKRNHGAARVWALEDAGGIVCTVGAYALHDGTAYLACGQTAEALRGRGIGGRLIVLLANELAAEGWQVLLLCAEERVHFYTRLGFAKAGTLLRCRRPDEAQP